MATDVAGNVYVADTGNFTIRKITPAGLVSTLAGSPGVAGSTNSTGTNALFYEPEGVAVDSSSNVFVADTWNHTIRKISSAGVVTTFAGSPGTFGSTDGTGAGALFYEPQGIAIDSSSNVYVADEQAITRFANSRPAASRPRWPERLEVLAAPMPPAPMRYSMRRRVSALMVRAICMLPIRSTTPFAK